MSASRRVVGEAADKERGRFVPGAWMPDPGAQTRAARQGSRRLAFIPDQIAGMELALPAEVAGALENATLAIRHLDDRAGRLGSLDAVALQLLRAESLASSRIEGLQVGHRRVALADFDEHMADARATDVLGNVRAMRRAIALAASGKSFDPDALLDIHRTLLRFGHDEPIAGCWRERQGWIGGVRPESAAYVPPPPYELPVLLDDLCRFAANEEMPVLCQAAIAHAQLESIHPFVDGNGRVGRCLIHAILRRRGLIVRHVPPISLILAARRKAYFAGLDDFRTKEGFYRWIAFFAEVAEAAARQADRLIDDIEALRGQWLARLPRPPRSDASIRRVLELLPAHPVLDVPTVMRELDISDRAAGETLNRLTEVGVLRLLTRRVRSRTWECRELFELVEAFERSLR